MNKIINTIQVGRVLITRNQIEYIFEKYVKRQIVSQLDTKMNSEEKKFISG